MDKNILIKKILGEKAHIISPLLGGMMNESYIVSNNEKKYVLYVPTIQANEMVDRTLEKECQAITYSLGITSKNIYFDTTTGIKINEYIEGHSLNNIEDYDLKQVAKILHTLHDSNILSGVKYQPFNRLINYEKEVKQFIDNFDDLYLEIRNELFNNKEFLEKQKVTICHNDAQRSNIIKSVDKKYYLIDFEFMADNDPIYDIATFGNSDVKEGFDLLNIYVNNPSTEIIKRYYLWRMYISLQWYVVALIKHYRGEGKVHNFNFLDVATHFINNAKEAYFKFKKI